MQTASQLKTLGEVARAVNRPVHQVAYAVTRYRIPETQRAGIIRLYDADAVEAIKRAIERISNDKGDSL